MRTPAASETDSETTFHIVKGLGRIQRVEIAGEALFLAYLAACFDPYHVFR